MSQQQQYMAAEVAKALDVVAETHRELAQLVRRLFVHWNLSDEEQLALLGRLPGDIAAGLSNGDVRALSADCEIAERIGHLLSIHQHLRTLFPQNRSLVYQWMTTPNDAFDGQTPVAVVRDQGVRGMLVLRAYLGHAGGS